MDQIWAWLPRGHRLAVGVRDPLKSSVTGPSLLVNCYLEIKFHKKIRTVRNPALKATDNTDHVNETSLEYGDSRSKILGKHLYYIIFISKIITEERSKFGDEFKNYRFIRGKQSFFGIFLIFIKMFQKERRS